MKVDAIGAFIVGVGQGQAFPPLVSLLLTPLFNAEAAVFDNDADNEIATMSKAVGNCEKKQDIAGDWKVSWEFQRTRFTELEGTDFLLPPSRVERTITENNKGESYFTVTCEEEVGCDLEGDGEEIGGSPGARTVRQSHFTDELVSQTIGVSSSNCYSEGDTGMQTITDVGLPYIDLTDGRLKFNSDVYFGEDYKSESPFKDNPQNTCTYTSLDGISSTHGPNNALYDYEFGIIHSFGRYEYVGPSYDSHYFPESISPNISMEMRDGATISDSIDKQFNNIPIGNAHLSGHWKMTLTKLNQQATSNQSWIDFR